MSLEPLATARPRKAVPESEAWGLDLKQLGDGTESVVYKGPSAC